MATARHRSVFDLPRRFFDGCRLLPSPSAPTASLPPPPLPSRPTEAAEDSLNGANGGGQRCTCNTCRREFESLQDQRQHFKSDLHRLNVKLSLAGKDVFTEEDFEGLAGKDDFDVSSISGSEEEIDKGVIREDVKQKLYFRLQSEDTVYVWRCLLLGEHDDTVFSSNKSSNLAMQEAEIIKRLNNLICEPRNGTCFRVVLLASGGHFAGCVFDGNDIVTHKTYHRYVVRARAGKQQSSKDATGKTAHSAGSSLRRYNEAALKKEIQELLVSWKRYIDLSSCIFISASSKNLHMLFDAEKPLLGSRDNVIRHVPLTVRRPTLKEARRVYNTLTYVREMAEKEVDVDNSPGCMVNDDNVHQQLDEIQLGKKTNIKERPHEPVADTDHFSLLSSREQGGPGSPLDENGSTPMHEASKSGNTLLVMELLEQGFDPCMKDLRGRTPYMLAKDKEARNMFRRFMALNLDKWDWHAAKVPSPLTEEMEDSQAAKQAAKDAKRKAKAKELKKLRKEKEKAKAEAAASLSTSVPDPKGQGPDSKQLAQSVSAPKCHPQSIARAIITMEEGKRRGLDDEREKRAAAAERRIAAACGASSASDTKADARPGAGAGAGTGTGDLNCSCCSASLAGKVPFHRYHYKYCSSSCMHAHREILESG